MKKRDADERFWEKVEKTDSCWNWVAYKDREGYGRFSVNLKCVVAHRYSFEKVNGPIADGLVLDHLCRNRACVNPAHLEAVTDRVNNLRGETIPAKNAKKTECKHGHPLSGDNLMVGKKGRRICRECTRQRCVADYVKHQFARLKKQRERYWAQKEGERERWSVYASRPPIRLAKWKRSGPSEAEWQEAVKSLSDAPQSNLPWAIDGEVVDGAQG